MRSHYGRLIPVSMSLVFPVSIKARFPSASQLAAITACTVLTALPVLPLIARVLSGGGHCIHSGDILGPSY